MLGGKAPLSQEMVLWFKAKKIFSIKQSTFKMPRLVVLSLCNYRGDISKTLIIARLVGKFLP